jgi:hypothetical protein
MKKALNAKFTKLDDHKEQVIGKIEKEQRIKLEMDNI